MLSQEIKGKDNTLWVATLSGNEQNKTWAKPIVDLNLGLRASYVVSKSVLCPRQCLELDIALSKTLKEYELILQKAEVSFSQEISELNKQRNALMIRVLESAGFVRIIKNWILSIRIKLVESQLKDELRDYDLQSHLQKVALAYRNTANNLIYHFQGWYTIQIPLISFWNVEKELLPTGEVSGKLGLELGLEKDQLKSLFNRCGFFYINVAGRELVRRSELTEVLNRFYPDRFTTYPF
jgi:hypothetical protein